MPDKQVEFVFDVGSPATYLAYTQLPRLLRETGASLLLTPVLLGAVFEATGNRSPAMVPAKGKYMVADFKRFATLYGVPFRFNKHFPILTMPLQRAVVATQLHDAGRVEALCTALLAAIWAESVNLNEPDEIRRVLTEAGFDAAQVLAQAQTNEVKARLKTNTEQAIARGVFGAPTFFVDEQMFWGQDRLDFVRRALQP